MQTRLIVILILICTACQSGRIPCPDARGPKIKKVKVTNKRPLEYTASISAYRDGSAKSKSSQGKEEDPKFVRSVSLEEWDCPRPGEKKYMPKSIKSNIRKNMKRLKSDSKRHESDSLRVN